MHGSTFGEIQLFRDILYILKFFEKRAVTFKFVTMSRTEKATNGEASIFKDYAKRKDKIYRIYIHLSKLTYVLVVD